MVIAAKLYIFFIRAKKISINEIQIYQPVIWVSINHNARRSYRLTGVVNKVWRRPTLPQTAVPSAQPGLTTLFGKGRGGTPVL